MLLLCYPRQYRRSRGEEIVATFLDLAPPDRTRPTMREAVNLVRHGLRCRLGRPRSRSVVLWAALTATVWGLFTGAFATRLAWESARPLPTQAEARELFTQILGRDSADAYVDPAMFVIYGQPLGWNNLDTLLSLDGGEYQQGRATVALNGPMDVDHEDLVHSTRAWLQANGWRVADVDIRNSVDCANASCDESTLPKKAVYTARRADDVLAFEVSLGDLRTLPPKPGVPDSNIQTYFFVELTRASPAAVFPSGAVGALLGMVFGWLTFGWASRRTEGRAGPTVLFGVAIFMWCAPMILSLPFTLAHHLNEPHLSWHPMWEWLGQPAFAPMFAIGAGAALFVLALSALPRRGPEPANQVRPAA
jgi:hypothetical protein